MNVLSFVLGVFLGWRWGKAAMLEWVIENGLPELEEEGWNFIDHQREVAELQ